MSMLLSFDMDQEVERIGAKMRDALKSVLARRGLVVGLSGGIDSSVSVALAVRAVGPERVLGLIMPDRDSSGRSAELAKTLADHLGIETARHDISDALEALGCYQWRDGAIRDVIPDYGEGWRNKIVIRGGLDGQINRYEVVVEDPQGNRQQARLPVKQYLQIVAATNFKQRVRKTLEYCWADRMNFAVLGTPNRLEYDQGFFVKHGDGAADIKPIAHLYKSQVYALARHLGLPEEICSSVPTTDTYSLAQGQDEFYFALPYQEMDMALYAWNSGWPAERLAETLNIDLKRAEHVYADIERKRRTTRYLHEPPVLVEPVERG